MTRNQSELSGAATNSKTTMGCIAQAAGTQNARKFVQIALPLPIVYVQYAVLQLVLKSNPSIKRDALRRPLCQTLGLLKKHDRSCNETL